MSDTVQRILDLSARLRELRGQLDRLDAERAVVRQQIDECMDQIGAAREDEEKEPMPEGIANQIRWALRRHRDRPLAPIDVAGMLRLRSTTDVANVRTLLARMARDGRARKVAHGRYMTTE
jgi:septal ring factor EnvC (AmiA/AmiB activator)